jgi:2-keto-4-pentenoate hydratase
MSLQDAVRNQKQVKELQEKGYFTLEDGTLSSSIKPKVKKILGKRTQGAKIAAVQEEEESESEVEVLEAVAAPKKRQRKN